jgi:Ca-activated chloride channel family protein
MKNNLIRLRIFAVLAPLFFAAAMSPVSLGADGLIVVSDPPHAVPGHFSFAPLAVTFHRVSVKIDGQVAVTTVDQEFFNSGDARLEGTYIFPLPEGAHIDRFAMDVNGRTMDAELLPADKARSLYEQIVRKMRDPALLEYAGRGAFKARIFPIEPRSKKRITISYTQLLRSDSGLVEYTYPLNTEKFSSAPISDVSVKVELSGKEALKSVYCPSHEAEVRRDGERRAVVGWEARDVRPDTDFVVVFSRKTGPIGIDMMASREPGRDGYFMLLASPGLEAPETAIAAKDICFVLDTSGSMAGVKLDQAKGALRQCLAGLNARDRFNVMRFSTEAEELFDAPRPVSKENVATAGRFVDGMRASGGTAMEEALAKSLGRGAGETSPYYVIFLTDGLPTVGETREDAIVDRVKKIRGDARVFTFGVGTDVNAHLLDRIASETRAVSQYVLPGEDIEVKVSSFAQKIRRPVMSNLSLSFTNPAVRLSQVHPGSLPDLFNGDMLVVFGRYSGAGFAAARLVGTVNGREREITADVSFPAEEGSNDYIPRLWAARRVGWLLDEIRLHGESAELRDEVVRLARDFGIVTPYTAYLILEDEARRDIPADLRSFQELESDRLTRGVIEEKMDSVRREAASETSRSGKAAVDNAMAVQSMKDVWNMAQASSPAEMKKKPAAGAPVSSGYKAEQARNYAAQVRVVDGRAFYQNGTVWTDSTAQSRRGLKQKKIRFNSDEYFGLLGKHPRIVRWLSLGNDMDIVVDDTLYNIREN